MSFHLEYSRAITEVVSSMFKQSVIGTESLSHEKKQSRPEASPLGINSRRSVLPNLLPQQRMASMLSGVEVSIRRPRRLSFLTSARTFCMSTRGRFFAKIEASGKLPRRCTTFVIGYGVVWHLTPRRGIQKRAPLEKKE